MSYGWQATLGSRWSRTLFTEAQSPNVDLD
jgi:hypothetical protein